jgi:hypothetical protein
MPIVGQGHLPNMARFRKFRRGKNCDAMAHFAIVSALLSISLKHASTFGAALHQT